MKYQIYNKYFKFSTNLTTTVFKFQNLNNRNKIKQQHSRTSGFIFKKPQWKRINTRLKDLHLLMRKTGAGRVFGAKCTDYDPFKYRSQMESQMDLNCTLVNQLLVLYSHKLYIWGRLRQFRKRFTHNWWKQELGEIFFIRFFKG